MAKAELLEPQSPDDEKVTSVGMAPDADVTPGAGIVKGPVQPSGCGAMPNEGIQGDEWGAYVTLGRTTGAKHGIAYGCEPMATEPP